MSDRLRLALFDCDGTLIDSQRTILTSMAAAFDSVGHPPPDLAAIRTVIGLSLAEAIVQLLGDAAAPGTVSAAEDAYYAAFDRCHADPNMIEPMYDGMADVLDWLDDGGWLLGVATGKTHAGLLATLRRHGLVERFQTLQTADRAAGKPSPDMVYRATRDCGVDPADTVVIGDTTFDMMMARNAGARRIGVSWGYHDVDDLHAAGADTVVTSCAELPEALAAVLDR